MAAGKYDLEVEQGATYTLSVTWKDSAGVVRNLATVWTARLKVRPAVGSATTLLSLTNGVGITLAATAPNITIVMTATETTSSVTQSGVYDLELVNGATVYRVLQGKVLYSLNVTT